MSDPAESEAVRAGPPASDPAEREPTGGRSRTDTDLGDDSDVGWGDPAQPDEGEARLRAERPPHHEDRD